MGKKQELQMLADKVKDDIIRKWNCVSSCFPVFLAYGSQVLLDSQLCLST